MCVGIFSLQEFFYYSIYDPAGSDVLSLAQQSVQQIVREMSADICSRLYEEILRDMKIPEQLKEHTHILSSLNPTDTSL